MPIICRICFSIYMFFHMTHIGSPPACGQRTRAGRDGKKRPTRKREVAANRKPPQEESCHPRGKRPPQPLPASMRSGPAAPSGKRVRPSYPDYDRRRVEDFAARTRWMPSAVARHSFASCPPLSPNTGVHTTHNARRIFWGDCMEVCSLRSIYYGAPLPVNARLRVQNAAVYLGFSVRRFHPRR